MRRALLTITTLTAVLTSSASAATPADSPVAPPDRDGAPSAREDCDARFRLVATLLLEGKAERARELAKRLLDNGALSGEGALSEAASDSARLRARRALEFLTADRPDPERALAVLGERPDSGDVAWTVARALALARAGEAHESAAAFEELARALRRGAGLELRHVRFASRVESFGVYDDDPRDAFRPGASVLLYAELRGFVCAPVRAPGKAENTTKGDEAGARDAADPGSADVTPETPPETWRVRLDVRVLVENFLTGEVGPMWGPEPVEHVTRARVRDLHLTQLVGLPADLPPGEYEMRIDVRDVGAGGARGVGLRRFVVGNVQDVR